MVSRNGKGGARRPCALRLGFRQIKGLAEEDAKALIRARAGGYAAPRDLWRRAGLGGGALDRLAPADAVRSLGLDRRPALWAVKGLGAPPLPLFAASEAPAGTPRHRPGAPLAARTRGQPVAADYA